MLTFWKESDVFWNRQNTYGVGMILWFQKEAAHFIVSAVTFFVCCDGHAEKVKINFINIFDNLNHLSLSNQIKYYLSGEDYKTVRTFYTVESTCKTKNVPLIY